MSNEGPQLWGRIIKKQKILMGNTVPCDPTDPQEAVSALCQGFDIGRPLWLSKHQKEYDQFGRTAFTKEHFMEPIAFTRFEVELILPDEQKRERPRNPLFDA